MNRATLGELEYRVMIALVRLGDDAYSASVVLELEDRTGRSVSAATVYIALRRLEAKGLVTSALRSPGPRQGRDRRHFALTELGLARLREEHAGHRRLVAGIEHLLEEAQ